MLKSIAFAALASFAALSAAQAATHGAAVDQPTVETAQQIAGLPKPKTPPRNPFGPKKTVEAETERLQFACQTGSLKTKCKPDLKLPGRPRA